MNHQIPRKLVVSENLQTKISTLFQQSKRHGIEASFRTSLHTIRDRLLHAPLPPDEDTLVFGDPAYRLPHLKLLVCHAFIAPIAINFSVSLEPIQDGEETVLPIYLMNVQLVGVQEG